MDRPTLLHRLELAAYRATETIAAWLSMESCAVLGRVLGGAVYLLSPGYRHLVRRNLRIATAADPPDSAALDRLVRETFLRAGTNFLCSLRSAVLDSSHLERHIRLGPAAMFERAPGSPGLVIALPHMGNWEVLIKLGTRYARPATLGAIYRPLSNPAMDELTHHRRSADGAVLFSRTDGFHAPIGLLRKPGVVAVLSDQRAGAQGTPMPFFGKLTTCTQLPVLMAKRAKAEIATLSNVTHPDGTWTATLTPLGAGADLGEVMSGLEESMRASLTDVFWFHDRWRVAPGHPLNLFTPIRPGVAERARVPLRIVLTLPDIPGSDSRILIDTLLAHRPDLRIDQLNGPPHPDPRVIRHHWDAQAPPEHADSVLRQIDALHPAPLDAALLFDGSPALARAARRLRLEAILGLDVSGKPWTRSLARPEHPDGWRTLADELAFIPRNRQR